MPNAGMRTAESPMGPGIAYRLRDAWGELKIGVDLLRRHSRRLKCQGGPIPFLRLAEFPPGVIDGRSSV
jgi:hypothetical protein